MGHFIISLPGNLVGDVRCGTIRKISFSLNFFSAKKYGNDKKTGYMVQVGPSLQKEYRFLKTREGHWTSEDNGGFLVTPDDSLSVEIKNAIDTYESQHKGKCSSC